MPITLIVNGHNVEALVEPRTHLADFLREHCRLTGTHLGCEHGVCGACTVLIEGEPARSCIAYAVACDGLRVETIEGLDGDPLMQALREAFTREHALQCGFCTPGMLIAARDIVRRLPGADERRIREELSGNLCRCTGYLGIVKAVHSVAATVPAPSVMNDTDTSMPAPFASFIPEVAVARAPSTGETTAERDEVRTGWTRFEESFVINKPLTTVWATFADVPTLAACLPGAELTEHDAQSVRGRMRIRLGPISAAFSGSALIERDEEAMRGVIRGAGSDRGTGSRTKGEVHYRLAPERENATRVAIVVQYSLQGALAQFSRSQLAQDLGRRLVAEFAANLNARLGTTGSETPAAPLNAGRLLRLWLSERLRRAFARRT
ncbi:MAG TPA: 2Fe-2S iron-sulfur cluster-binding protein [Xanthobacteraceae bacterium]|nr:2Fe-2S iron-sulfur cluster-binding protein [Xanthobacteraceae bacterium]